MTIANRRMVKERVAECFAIATERFGQTFPMPTIVFKKRGTTAGTAAYRSWTLDFNEVILNDNTEQFVRQTVAHECAHLIDHQVYGSLARQYDYRGRPKKRQPHGANWKRCMAVLGVPADRCHNMDVSNAKQARRVTQTFQYHCEGCNETMPMGKIRHNKQRAGKANYRHCRGHKLTYVG